MKFVLFIALLFACATSLFAQNILSATATVVQGTLEVGVTATCTDSTGAFYETATSGIDPSASGSCVTEKLSASGAVIWTNYFSLPPDSECFPEAVLAGKTGDAFVLGFIRQDKSYTEAPFLLHISGGGSTLWSVIEPSPMTYPLGIAEDSSGNPIVAMLTASGFNLIKYNEATSAVMFSVAENFPLAGYSGFSFSNQLIGGSTGYLYLLGQATGTPVSYFVIRVNEATGAVVWNKPLTANGSLTQITPSHGTVLASGDVVIAGTGSAGPNTYTVATLDRMAAASGAFTYRQFIGPKTTGMSASFNVAPVTDQLNQAYWSVNEFNGSTFVSSNLLGKCSAAGFIDWSTAAPSAYDWLLTPSTTGGLFAAWDNQSGLNVGQLSPTGQVLWQDLSLTGPSAYNGAVSVDTSNNFHLAGQRIDPNHNLCFGLVAVNGANHAVSLNQYFSPPGNEDNRYLRTTQDGAGNTYAIETRNYGGYLDKLSVTGAVTWRTPVAPGIAGVSPADVCYSNLGFVVVGLATPKGAELVKINSVTGSVIWSAPITFTSATNFYSPVKVLIDPTGNVDLSTSVSNGSLQSVAVQVDQFGAAAGAHLWTYSLPVESSDGVCSLDSLGDVYVGGYLKSTSQFVLAKLNTSGKAIFKNFYAQTISPASILACHLTCDTATGNTYLCESDYYKGDSLTNSQTALQLQAIDSKGLLRWKMTYPMVAFWDPFALDGRVVGGYVYLRFLDPHQHTLSDSTIIDKIDPNSGALIWQNVHLSALASKGEIEEFPSWAFDPYGNPVVSGESILLQKYVGLYEYVPGEAFVYKVDRTTGVTRWSTVSQGSLTSAYNHLPCLTIGSTDQPLLLGQTPSATGPGSVNALTVRLASPPHSADDAYKCLKNQPLPITAASVLQNDEDVSVATCAVLTPPKHAATFALSPSGKITYTPVAGYLGTDTFTYRATNAQGPGNTATVTITVSAN